MMLRAVTKWLYASYFRYSTGLSTRDVERSASGLVYSFEKLEKVDKGLVSKRIEDIVEVVGAEKGTWSIQDLPLSH